MTSRDIVSVGLLVLALAVVSTGWSPASAQLRSQEVTDPDESFLASTHLSIGYAVNAPEQLVGVSASTAGSKWSGWGLYADYKLSVATPEGDDSFTEDLTVAEAKERGYLLYTQPESAWNTVNVALVRAVAHEVALYGGAGYSHETVYREYVDETRAPAPESYYTVEDESEGGDAVNVMGGLLFRASRHLIFQVGGETAPAGFTAGASAVFPIGR